MNRESSWPALLIGAIMTLAFAYYIFDIVRVLLAISDSSSTIPFDTGFGLLALAGLAPLIAAAEFCYQRKLITQEILNKWGSRVLISLFLILAFFGYFTSDWLTEKLKSAGYKACLNPLEISRISIGHSLVFMKNSCESLK